jgi:DNA-binding Lrp family transcriptional regulator
MSNDTPRQDDLFADPHTLKAELTWFHIFRTMINSPAFAELPAASVKVYLVIKAHTDFSNGHAFPGIPVIAKKAGYSEPQVKRILQDLQERKLITKTKAGRSNSYMLHETVDIFDEKGMPVAVAGFDYLPSTVQRAVGELKNVLVTGQLGNAKIVHIERLQINVNNLRDNAVNFNVQQFLADVEKLPKHLRQAAKDAIDRAELRDDDGAGEGAV